MRNSVQAARRDCPQPPAAQAHEQQARGSPSTGPPTFSAQGAAKVGGPVLAGTARLLLVGLGGWWLGSSGAPAWTLFALVGAAMAVYGLGTALSVALTRWGK